MLVKDQQLVLFCNISDLFQTSYVYLCNRSLIRSRYGLKFDFVHWPWKKSIRFWRAFTSATCLSWTNPFDMRKTPQKIPETTVEEDAADFHCKQTGLWHLKCSSQCSSVHAFMFFWSRFSYLQPCYVKQSNYKPYPLVFFFRPDLTAMRRNDPNLE